jgi:hypothetical protein
MACSKTTIFTRSKEAQRCSLISTLLKSSLHGELTQNTSDRGCNLSWLLGMCDKKLKLLIIIAGIFKQPQQFEYIEVLILYLPWLLGTSDQKLMSKIVIVGTSKELRYVHPF